MLGKNADLSGYFSEKVIQVVGFVDFFTRVKKDNDKIPRKILFSYFKITKILVIILAKQQTRPEIPETINHIGILGCI